MKCIQIRAGNRQPTKWLIRVKFPWRKRISVQDKLLSLDKHVLQTHAGRLDNVLLLQLLFNSQNFSCSLNGIRINSNKRQAMNLKSENFSKYHYSSYPFITHTTHDYISCLLTYCPCINSPV